MCKQFQSEALASEALLFFKTIPHLKKKAHWTTSSVKHISGGRPNPVPIQPFLPSRLNYLQ